VAQSCQIEQYELVNTVSIGIAMYPQDGHDFETLSKNADTAMYRVKRAARNDFCFFTQEMQANSARSLQLVNALRHALARNELSLAYQPMVTIQDARVIGAEALLRWHQPELGPISPAEFIALAEESGQILEIGEWVLRSAVAQLGRWLQSGLPPMIMAVNLSAVQFRHPNLLEMVTRILDEAGVPHSALELELTEATAMDNPDTAIAIMNRLHEHGIRMSIDDFGTGYSSLSHLKKFKVSKLKIDQSFVSDIINDSDDKAIVKAIINMARSLGLKTIAEGVETVSQLDWLRLQGCDEVQGYFFSQPLSADAFEQYWRQQK
jgi:EAL domain-containing protein (putative c-di-GMP-specific phosphodiesterase class I)